VHEIIRFGVGQASHSIVKGLTIRRANESGVFAWIPRSYLTARNVVAKWNWHSGFLLNSHYPHQHPHSVPPERLRTTRLVLTAPAASPFSSPPVDSNIYRNRFFENGKQQSMGTVFDEEQWCTFGIKLWDYSLRER
jgi:hypothetical protein